MLTAREKARIVAGRVAARIREVAPEGLGRWDLAWELVAAPSDDYGRGSSATCPLPSKALT